MSGSWYFHSQKVGKESKWDLALASDREKIIAETRPAFYTVLDLSSVPEDSDWSKVRYRGPFYADFDSDDLEVVIDQFQSFLGKLDAELDFDITQARLYATGGRGFHIEIPQECFIPKVPPTGVPYLAYIYREMAQSLMVDTLDLQVFTGKRGRMWRTPNVKRDNGNYKVPLSVSDALSMTPDLYATLVSEPRAEEVPTPPVCNSKFALLYERCRDKIVSQMRGKKKRQERANATLDPWKKAKKTPPTIEKMMAGENLAEGARFQSIALQLGIYATSVGMPLAEYLDRCKGLCENHVSDSNRYNTLDKRRNELARMWEYLEEDTLYDFDAAPILHLLAPGTAAPDLGVMPTEDSGDEAVRPVETDTGDEPAEISVDSHKQLRRGFFMNSNGMFKRTGDIVESVCRATLRNVTAFYDLEKDDFKGYEFNIVMPERKPKRAMLSGDAFTSANSLKKFMAAHQISYQGTDPDAASLLDIMAEKAGRGGKVYCYPREGFFVVNNPEHETPEPVKVYLTQDTYMASVRPGDPDYFELRYRPGEVSSSYNIDVHKAPDLDESMAPALRDLFSFSRPDILADTIGWFVACHYRSAYLKLFDQFPSLQIYGEAGSGKTQTVLLLAHLHWYMPERITINSATSCTAYVMDALASTSTSAPFILDEYKPRELRASRGKYEKLKDILKAAYVGANVGGRGTVNRGAENHMGMIKSKATAPVCFMGESIEMETAIIERCVTVGMAKSEQTAKREAAFERLKKDPVVLSALGKAIIEMGFALNLEAMRDEVKAIQSSIRASLPDFDDEHKKRAAPRLIFNRAIVIHALRTLKRVLQRTFDDQFDVNIDELLGVKAVETKEETRIVATYGMSEISKVMNRIALLSRARDEPHEMRMGKDYIVGDGWVEMKTERAYDAYRRYCASIADTPLFDNLDAFGYALNSYSPCVDRVCASSELRADDTTEKIVRLDMRKLAREGVQTFRS